MISNTNDNSMSVGTSWRSHREIQIDCNFVVPSLEPEQLILVSRSYPSESLHGGGTYGNCCTDHHSVDANSIFSYLSSRDYIEFRDKI